MNKIILLLVISIISLVASDNAMEGYVFGLSKHSNQSINYNEVNQGVGLGYAHKLENEFNSSYDTYMTVIGGVYKDSYYETATFLMPGFRIGFGDMAGMHFTAGMNAGYFNGSDFKGLGVMPSVTVGYDRFDICFSGIPAIGGGKKQEQVSNDPRDNRHATGGVVAMFIKIRLMDW